MCGLGGVFSSSMVPAELTLARNLVLLNSFRGEDSTGMFTYTEEAKTPIQYWKTLHHPIEFAGNVFGKLIKDKWKHATDRPDLIAVHCRAATQGAVTQKNCHPFIHKNSSPDHGSIIGMHNGTVEKDFKNRKKFETDSEAIFYNITTSGLKEALEMMKSASPAFALVWFDQKDDSINFIRNDKRPLTYLKAFSGNLLLWSSERQHLQIAVENARYSTVGMEVLAPYTHLKARLNGSKVEYTEDKIENPETVLKIGYSQYWGGEGWNEDSYGSVGYWENLGKTNSELGTWDKSYDRWDAGTNKWYTAYQYKQLLNARKKEGGDKKKDDKPLNDELPFTLPKVGNGKVIEFKKEKDEPFFQYGVGLKKRCTAQVLRYKLSKGCANCGCLPDIVDYAFWWDDDSFLCEDCTEDLYTDPKVHWISTSGVLSEDAVQTLCDEYSKYVMEKYNA